MYTPKNKSRLVIYNSTSQKSLLKNDFSDDFVAAMATQLHHGFAVNITFEVHYLT
jgi:hypothetical protein